MQKPGSAITAAYYCKQLFPDGLIQVFNHHHYLMAEYDALTGEARWQRVLPAAQRLTVERWLSEQFSLKKQVPARTKAKAAGAK